MSCTCGFNSRQFQLGQKGKAWSSVQGYWTLDHWNTVTCLILYKFYICKSILTGLVLCAPDQAVPDQKLYKLLLIDGWLSLITMLQNALSVVAHIFLTAAVLYAPDQAVPKLLLIDGWLSLIATLQNALSVVAHIFFILMPFITS